MDAIKIRIYDFEVHDRSVFPETHMSADRGRVVRILTNNVLRKHLERGGEYAPKYHIEIFEIGAYQRQTLVVEFSVPKLLYGNNLQEVYERDLSRVVLKLKSFLRKVGVKTSASAIRSGVVTMIEYSRNVRLGDFCTSDRLLSVLSLFNYRPRSEFSSIIRGSHSELKYHNKSTQFVAYDKVLEIQGNAKTREEKEIVQCIKRRDVESRYWELATETVRFELKLETQSAVKGKMARWYSHRRNYTFKHVFKDSIRNALLGEEMKRIFDYPLLPILLFEDEDIEWELIQQYPVSLDKRKHLHYLVSLLKRLGSAEFRNACFRKSSRSTWMRINKEFEQLSEFARSYLANRPTNAQIVGFIQAELGIGGQESNTRQNSATQ